MFTRGISSCKIGFCIYILKYKENTTLIRCFKKKMFGVGGKAFFISQDVLIMVLKSWLIKDASCGFILMVLLHNPEMGVVHPSPTPPPHLISLPSGYCTCDGTVRVIGFSEHSCLGRGNMAIRPQSQRFTNPSNILESTCHHLWNRCDQTLPQNLQGQWPRSHRRLRGRAFFQRPAPLPPLPLFPITRPACLLPSPCPVLSHGHASLRPRDRPCFGARPAPGRSGLTGVGTTWAAREAPGSG